MNLKLSCCCLPDLYTQGKRGKALYAKEKKVSLPEASKGQKGAEGQYGQIMIALDFKSDFRKCLIALGMRYVGGIRRFTSFDQPIEKAFMLSVSGHKYLELNFLDFRLISEANLLIDIFPQRCSRILIKG